MPVANESIERLQGRLDAYEKTLEGQGEGLHHLRTALWGTDPTKPGLALRLDRVERLLATMLKIGYAIGAVGLLWKVLDVVGAAIGRSAGL